MSISWDANASLTNYIFGTVFKVGLRCMNAIIHSCLRHKWLWEHFPADGIMQRSSHPQLPPAGPVSPRRPPNCTSTTNPFGCVRVKPLQTSSSPSRPQQSPGTARRSKIASLGQSRRPEVQRDVTCILMVLDPRSTDDLIQWLPVDVKQESEGPWDISHTCDFGRGPYPQRLEPATGGQSSQSKCLWLK